MNVKTKRKLSVWVLLSVFVPMLVLSSLHIHQEAVHDVEECCAECVNHIPHSGHISLQTVHTCNCVLCQFVSLPFVVAALLALTVTSAAHVVLSFVRPSLCLEGVSHHYQPRAPPVI